MKQNLSKIISLLNEDKIISLISDAGTPGISDPGSILVNECIKRKVNVFRGSSAVTTAVSASGFGENIYFMVFPEKEKIINEKMKILVNLDCCLVFFISPKKINKIIPKIKEYFQGRSILICREISKFYEEYIRCSVEELKLFKSDLKGELTIVISEKDENKKVLHKLNESDKRNIKKMINKLSTKEITNLITQNTNISKKEVYQYCLKIKNEK